MIFLRRRVMLIGIGVSALLPSVYAAEPNVIDETWTDAQRQRTLPVKLRVPNRPGPWPVVLFSHGLGGSREGGARWGEAWAEAGYVVLHLQHPGSDGDALRRSRQAAVSAAQLANRTDDVLFALDEISRRVQSKQGPWANADASRIGLAGHSFGALTTMAMAGQSFAGQEPIREPRLKAFIALSPAGGVKAEGAAAARFGTLRGPMLFITGTNDGDVIGNGETPESRQLPFAHAPAGEKYLWVLKDADHMSFAGSASRRLFERAMRRSEEAKNAQQDQQQQVAALTTLYWDAMLRGDDAARKQLAKPGAVAANDVWRVK